MRSATDARIDGEMARAPKPMRHNRRTGHGVERILHNPRWAYTNSQSNELLTWETH